MGLVGQAGEATEALDPMTFEAMLETTFLSYVGYTPELLPYFDPVTRPRLAILDTTPTDGWDPRYCASASMHGDTLVHMADRLLCRDVGTPERDCAATITTRLTLPWETYTADGKVTETAGATCFAETAGRGGMVGTIGYLATAIVSEVEAWLDSDPKGGLILNLSVGWDGELFGGYERERDYDGPPEAARAVLDALRYAARHNVLVIAAAGNSSWGPEPGARAVLPAGWEERTFRGAPLVYAVGGLRSLDAPLGNSRPGATWASLMAYGDHATVRPAELFSQPERTTVLTGTSVSTLIVSSAAALVWAKHPQLSPSAVMQEVYAKAAPLGRMGEISAWPEDGNGARHVRLCQIVPGHCSEPLRAADLNWSRSGLAEQISDQAIEQEEPTYLSDCLETLHPGTYLPSSMDAPCPHRQFPSSQASDGTHPQPGSPMCPACDIDPDGQTAFLDFDEKLVPLDAQSAILAIGDMSFVIQLDREDRPELDFGTQTLPPIAEDELGAGHVPVLSIRFGNEKSLVDMLWTGPP